MEPNYFTCTLGQAAALGIQQPHQSINDLIDALAEGCADRPAVAFAQPGARAEDEWTSLLFTFRDIKLGSEQAASLLLQNKEPKLSKRQTVGLLCPSTPEFLFTWLALMRLGHAVLLIAPQCQPVAIASLCKTCEVSLLFYDDVYQDLAQDSARTSRNATDWALEVASVPSTVDPASTAFLTKTDGSSSLPSVSLKKDEIAYLHHTSGTSSGMPKPIPQTHRAGVGVLPSFLDGHQSATFTTTPLYHGGIADLFRAWTSKALIWLFPGKRVPITATNIVKCLDAASDSHRNGTAAPVRYFSSVPYVLQMMEADERGLRYLQNMAIVGVGGAALPTEVGDRLVKQGVNLISRFGSAECGFLLSSHREYEKDKEWQYLRVAPGAEKYLRLEPQHPSGDGGESSSELVVLKGWPHMAKRNREDGSYATADLFAPHPSIANAWRYHSRADSQLTLITGKKFDPAPLEAALASSSQLLDDVLIFGNNRPYPGALLFRSQEARNLSDNDLLQQVWPQMEKLNSESQDHARMSKSMLVPMQVLDQPLEKSSKGTILRGAVEKRFQERIEDSYQQTEGADGVDDVPDEELAPAVHDMISSVVAKGGSLTYTTELFAYGVDSVAGMQIRSRLRRLLPADAKPLPINVVEDCGTVERIADYLRKRRHGEEELQGNTIASEHKYMLELVEEHSKVSGIHHGTLTNGHADHTNHAEHGEVVVLTGATGALGAHILDQYRQKAEVKKIYCLVRGATDTAALERVEKALIQRKLDPLDTDKKVQVVQAALGEVHLGLHEDVYNRIANEATVIMHVAWSVNFRMKLRSFVKDNIAGVTNLINLALASPRAEPPHFAFCSSVASAMAYKGGDVVPEKIIDEPDAATDLGYSQSKWVAEHICQRASQITKLKGRISLYRVGQLAGDSRNGVWNTKEAWPMMLSAVTVTGNLPDLENEKLDWLAVDVAAAALIQGPSVPIGGDELAVYHVLNENDRPRWKDLLGWLKKEESFEVVPPAQWVGRLEDAVNKGSTHPASQLLDHWKRAYIHEDEGKAEEGQGTPPTFAMVRTKDSLAALRSVAPVDQAYFEKLWMWIKSNM